MDKSDNYTKFPNNILDAICKYHFSALQIEVILYVVRKTEGYRKKSDTIAVSKIARDIKRSRCKISVAVNSLEKINVIEIQRTGLKAGNRMRVKDPAEWSQPVTKQEHVTKKSHVTKREQQVLPNGNATCYQTVTHKRNSTKETLQKKPPKPPTDEFEELEGFADRPFGEMYTPEEEERLRAEGWT